MYQLTKTCEFDAAHFLPDYMGPCHNMHGHRYVVMVDIEAESLPESGMVMDFAVIKKIVNTLDHELLNKYLHNPTAENIAAYIFEAIKGELNLEVVDSLAVTILETPTSKIRYTAPLR